MSYLRAENGSYLIFISVTQSPPSGTYRLLVNTCWITELNNECIITKYFSHSPFFAWVPIWICESVQVKTSYIYSPKLWCLWKWESLKAKENTHPAIVSVLWRTNYLHNLTETHPEGFQEPALCPTLCVHSNYEWHRNWGTAGLLKATQVLRVGTGILARCPWFQYVCSSHCATVLFRIHKNIQLLNDSYIIMLKLHSIFVTLNHDCKSHYNVILHLH